MSNRPELVSCLEERVYLSLFLTYSSNNSLVNSVSKPAILRAAKELEKYYWIDPNLICKNMEYFGYIYQTNPFAPYSISADTILLSRANLKIRKNKSNG